MLHTPLPRNEDGFVENSASFGHAWVVVVTYYTDFDGRQIDEATEEYPRTLHGPFFTEEEAVAWIEDYPDGDTDIEDMVVWTLNLARPVTPPVQEFTLSQIKNGTGWGKGWKFFGYRETGDAS